MQYQTLLEQLEPLSPKLTVDEKEFVSQVRGWVDTVLRPEAPLAWEKGELPRQWIKDIAKNGWLATSSTSTFRKYALLCQELERGDSGVRSFVSVHCSLAMQAIKRFGSQAQKDYYLPKLMKGELLAAFSLTEPDAGSDPSAMKTTAKQTGDAWLLQGYKHWSTSATIADIVIVFAMTKDGMRGFILHKDDEGFKPRTIAQKGSLRISESAEIFIENCSIPLDRLLPGTESGLTAALSCLSMARAGISFGVLGSAQLCFDKTLDYTIKRKQFGVSLASKQLVQDKLVTCFLKLSQARLLAFQLAARIDEYKTLRKGDLQLADIKELTPLISMAKKVSCATAREVVSICRNLLGANGILLSYEVIRHFANLESVYTYEGTDDIHTLIVGKALTSFNAF